MRTIQVTISDTDYTKYGFQEKSAMPFSDLEDIISIEYAKKALKACNDIAEKTGLSKMSLEEINAEIKAVRDAKNNS